MAKRRMANWPTWQNDDGKLANSEAENGNRHHTQSKQL